MTSEPARLQRLSESLAAADRLLAHQDPEAAVALLDQLLAEGPWPGEIPQALTHNLATALRQCALQQMQSGDLAAAMQKAARMFAVPLPPGLPAERVRGRAEILTNLGTDFMNAVQPEHALLCFRQAIALYPCPTFSNNLISILAKLGRPAVLADYCDTLEPKDLAPRILLACQPKSGSTFLRNVLQEVTGWREIYLCLHTELSAQDLFYPVLLEYARTPTVTHQHCRATEANVQLMQAFGIRPVILVRDLHDVIVSLRDYFNGGAIRTTQFEEAAWQALPPERQTDQIIDLVVPWHLEFLATWQKADRTGRLPVLWMTYAQMVQDKAAAVRRILTFYGLEAADERIASIIAKVGASPERNRFNKGVSGRGRDGLTSEQKARILRLAAYFPATDFTMLGIGDITE